VIFLLACAGGAETVRTSTPESGGTPQTTDTATPSADSAEPAETSGPCPTGMLLVEGAFCMDLTEAALEEYTDGAWQSASPYQTVDGRTVRAVVTEGSDPQGYISGEEAAEACEAASKRLCTTGEWLSACQGPSGATWPYGDTHITGACNDSYAGSHPVVDYFGTSDGVWDTEHMNDPGINQQPDSLSPAGAHPDCVSAWGVLDLHGNLHEWIDDPDGTFRGGFYADASINGEGCTYTTTAHSTGYHDYSTGFRCCAEPL